MTRSRKVLLLALLLWVVLFWGCQQSFSVQLSNCSDLAAVCDSLEGTPYIWGGRSPRPGFDCSGAVYHVAKRMGQPVPRTTARKYWVCNSNPWVHWQKAQCGYLVWWQFSRSRPYGHIGIMVSNPSFWQAGSSTGFVKRVFDSGNFWDTKFQGSKEFLNEP